MGAVGSAQAAEVLAEPVEPLEEPAAELLVEPDEDFDSELLLLAAGVLLDDEPRLSVR
jgi:hypothetical protein